MIFSLPKKNCPICGTVLSNAFFLSKKGALKPYECSCCHSHLYSKSSGGVASYMFITSILVSLTLSDNVVFLALGIILFIVYIFRYMSGDIGVEWVSPCYKSKGDSSGSK